jgi:hypothetical protein
MTKVISKNRLLTVFAVSIFSGCGPQLTVIPLGSNLTPPVPKVLELTENQKIRQEKSQEFQSQVDTAIRGNTEDQNTWLLENDASFSDLMKQRQFVPTTLDQQGTLSHSGHGTGFEGGPIARYGLLSAKAVKLPETLSSRPLFAKLDFLITVGPLPAAAEPNTQTKVRELFIQGLNQLHGFQSLEAERSFKEAWSLAPSSPMIYWGLAMANTIFFTGQPQRALSYIQKADALKAYGNPTERGLIDALLELFKSPSSSKIQRQIRYVKKLQDLAKGPHSNIEVKAIYVEAIWELGLNFFWDKNYQGYNFSSEFYASMGTDIEELNSMLDQVLAQCPNHPAHHYKIHLWDDENPTRALDSAREIGFSSPTVAHMWHMAAHIYLGLGRFRDMARATESSARADHSYMLRADVMPYEIHNYFHNNSWLVRASARAGKIKMAVETTKDLIRQPRHPVLNNPHPLNDEKLWTGSAQLALQHEAYQHLIVAYNKWDFVLDDKIVYDYLLETPEDSPSAKFNLSLLLDACVVTARKDCFESHSKNLSEALKKELDIEGVKKRINIFSASTAVDFVKAYNDSGAIPKQLAPAALEKALDLGVSNEKLLFELLNIISTTKKSLAYLTYETRVWWALGNIQKMNETFKILSELASDADVDDDFFTKNIPTILVKDGKWAQARNWPADLSEKMDFSFIEKLGPLTWEPRKSPSIAELPVADDRPTLLVFYLGPSCESCVPQIKDLSALYSKLKNESCGDPSFDVVAVSSEGPDSAQPKTSGFPVVVDSNLKHFKSFGLIDQFDPKRGPLHGIFLISQGKILWRDISTVPFNNLTFLFKETQRLVRDYGPVTEKSCN